MVCLGGGDDKSVVGNHAAQRGRTCNLPDTKMVSGYVITASRA